MPSEINKGLILAGTLAVLIGVLLIAVKNTGISWFGFFLGMAGIVVLVVAIPKASGRSA